MESTVDLVHRHRRDGVEERLTARTVDVERVIEHQSRVFRVAEHRASSVRGRIGERRRWIEREEFFLHVDWVVWSWEVEGGDDDRPNLVENLLSVLSEHPLNRLFRGLGVLVGLVRGDSDPV